MREVIFKNKSLRRLEAQELVNMDLDPLYENARSYSIPLDAKRCVEVRFSVRNALPERPYFQHAENEVPSADEVCDAIWLMFAMMAPRRSDDMPAGLFKNFNNEK